MSEGYKSGCYECRYPSGATSNEPCHRKPCYWNHEGFEPRPDIRMMHDEVLSSVDGWLQCVPSFGGNDCFYQDIVQAIVDGDIPESEES